MNLSFAQKEHIFRNGFVKIPGVVPKIMIHQALRAINHSVGQGMNVEDMVTYRSQSFCPELVNTPVIADLFNKTPAKDLAEAAIGEGKIKPVRGGQIALRFPSMADRPGTPGCHLDGMYSPHNGVPKGTISNFTALVGVLLSDVPHPNSGNFTVWPGSHHLFEQYFREHGPESLLNGMPPIDMPQPLQITGEAGDIVLCHYQLAHGVGPNISPFTRYAIFFRLTHIEHMINWKAPMTDIWMHWPGVSEIADSL